MTTKQEFIEAISQRLGRPKPHEIHPPDFPDHPADGLYDVLSQEDVVNLFADELRALGGTVVRTSKPEQAIHSFLHESNFNDVVIWDDDSIYGELIRRSVESYAAEQEDARVIVWRTDGNHEALIRKAEQSDAGLVFAEWGIAETGTVVLFNRGGRGRSVSLLPNNIGVLLPANKIVPRITHVLECLADPALSYSCINFISGPSRSADIEMSLSIGVHGPGKITVFLVEQQTPVA